jgi:hypothetical protein
MSADSKILTRSQDSCKSLACVQMWMESVFLNDTSEVSSEVSSAYEKDNCSKEYEHRCLRFTTCGFSEYNGEGRTEPVTKLRINADDFVINRLDEEKL